MENLKKKVLTSDQYDRSRDDFNQRMETMKKSIQGFQMMSEKLNTQMGEMMTELMNKADNRRIDKIEMQLYQFALKENVEKLAL